LAPIAPEHNEQTGSENRLSLKKSTNDLTVHCRRGKHNKTQAKSNKEQSRPHHRVLVVTDAIVANMLFVFKAVWFSRESRMRNHKNHLRIVQAAYSIEWFVYTDKAPFTMISCFQVAGILIYL
jgi:hypothetical protein